MKRVLLTIWATVCIFGMSSCGINSPALETSAPVSIPIQTVAASGPNEERNWSEQKISSMFARAQEQDWEYIDCVLMPDYAGGRIGAVLFRDGQKGTSNVAFFNSDGFYHQCGTYAKLSAKPDFTYLGNGAVAFKLESEDGTANLFTITISVDGSDVNFKTNCSEVP